MAQFFNSQDAPRTKDAEIFCTIGDRRYSMLNAKNFEANASVSLADVKRLGTPIIGKKAIGLEVKVPTAARSSRTSRCTAKCTATSPTWPRTQASHASARKWYSTRHASTE